jgi:hypothetical protein
MRNLIAALVWGAMTVQAAPPAQVTNLDTPGALARLKTERPAHYAKVIEEMNKVQAVPFSDRGLHHLRLNPDKEDPTRRAIETSDPAKTRMTILVESVAYTITVLYTKDPATLSHAK